MVNTNGNMEKNYHGLQALNCVECKDNTKGLETNRSWASKAALHTPCPAKKREKKRFCILKFHQNKDTRRCFIQPASDEVSTNFSAPIRNYLCQYILYYILLYVSMHKLSKTFKKCKH